MMDEAEEACRDVDAAAEVPGPNPPLSPLSPLSPPLPAPPDTFAYPVVTSPDPDPPPRSECSPDNNTVSRRSVEGSSSVASSRIRHLPEPGQTMVPEREPLTFDVEKLSTEECMAMEGLLRLLDDQLWHWKNFPINLPDPIIQAKADTLGPGAGARSLKVNDLFVVPDFDELKSVAMGPSGEIRRLSEDQLDALRDTGEFEVPSQKFPGQRHKWRVSRLLIKGSANTKKAFYGELSKALYLIVVTARNCVKGRTFSVMESINGWSRGVMSLVDMIFGLPMLDRADVEHEIEKERSRYLVAELMCPPDRLLALSGYLSVHGDDVRRRSHLRPLDLSRCPPAPIPHRFFSPQGLELDFHLFSSQVMEVAKPRLHKILNETAMEWFVNRRKELLEELQERTNLTNDEVKTKATEILRRECINHICEEVFKDEYLRQLGQNVPALLVEQFRTSLAMQDAVKHYYEDLDSHTENFRTEVKTERPLLSQVKPWFSRRERRARAAFAEENGGRAHQEASQACGELGVSAGAYFVGRDLSFRKDQEPVLRKELRKITRPTRVIDFEANIWLPKNYVIKERFPGGEEKVIPTILKDDVDWKEEMDRCREAGEKRHFELIKTRRWTVSSGGLFWRPAAFASHTAELLLNAVFYFGLVVPFVSPVSFAAVYRLSSFPAGYRLNYYNGELLPSSRKIETVYTLIQSLQQHIRERRAAFEERPDTMLLSKALGRFFNQFHLYFLLGFFGHAFLVLLMPLGCILLSTLSLLLALTAIVWVPIVCAIFYFIVIIFYDYHGQRLLNGILWNILVNILFCGIVQPIACAIMAFIICPLGAAIVASYASIHWLCRESWDSLMYAIVLKRAARVPAAESFLARRVAGPGLASKFFYQIRPEQALVALETKMEVDELDTYQRATTKLACEPLKQFIALTRRLFGPFGTSPNYSEDGPCKKLKYEETSILSNLTDQIALRKNDLKPKLLFEELSKIRLSETDLRIVLQQGTLMTKDFYPPRVFSRMTTDEKRRFWAERGLAEGDWLGLACCLLADYFSRDFLTPLQELDVVFSLEVKDWTLRRYMDLITKTRTKEELDLAKLVYPRRGSTAGRVDPTSLTFPNYSVEDFNPRSDVGGLFLPPPTAQMMNVDDRCKTLTLMTSASSGTGCSGGRNKDYNTIRWRRPRRDVDVLWHRREEEGLWRLRKRPPPPPDRPLLGHRLLLPHPTEVALLVLKKREDGGGGDVKAEKKSKKWDWWMIEDMGVALQELPWLPENGAAAAAVDASPLQRRGSKASGGGKRGICGRHNDDGDSSSSADISDALLGGGSDGERRARIKQGRTTVVDVERGGETQSRMAGKGSGSQPGTPV